MTRKLVSLAKHLGIMVLTVALGLSMSVGTVNATKTTAPSAAQQTLLKNIPGVVYIAKEVTGQLTIQASGYAPLAGVGFEFSTGGTGTGFVVTPDGYIVTNGHVAHSTEEDIVSTAIYQTMDDILATMATVELMGTLGRAPTQAELDAILPVLKQELGGEKQIAAELYREYMAGGVALNNVETKIYVMEGLFASGKRVLNDAMQADVKEYDWEGWDHETGEVKGGSKDIALLKVSGENMPTIKIGDSGDVEVGDELYVVGYPGVAFMALMEAESQMEPTVTSGIVSSLKKMADGSDIIQSDAIIHGGNSGGPVCNMNGEVIGIASMGSVDPYTGMAIEGISLMRPAKLAIEFMRENGVENTQGPVDETYAKGLEYYWARKYTKAIKEFERVQRLYPRHPEVDDLIVKSEEAIANGEEDRTGLWIALGAIGGGVIILLIIIILIVVLKKKKKVPAATATETPKAPPKA